MRRSPPRRARGAHPPPRARVSSSASRRVCESCCARRSSSRARSRASASDMGSIGVRPSYGARHVPARRAQRAVGPAPRPRATSSSAALRATSAALARLRLRRLRAACAAAAAAQPRRRRRAASLSSTSSYTPRASASPDRALVVALFLERRLDGGAVLALVFEEEPRLGEFVVDVGGAQVRLGDWSSARIVSYRPRASSVSRASRRGAGASLFLGGRLLQGADRRVLGLRARAADQASACLMRSAMSR